LEEGASLTTLPSRWRFEDDVARQPLKVDQLLETDHLLHHDVYQLLAYCTPSNVDRGLLIYPAHEISVRDEVQIRNTSVSVRQTTINLGRHGGLLRQACDRLADEVFGWMKRDEEIPP
jgi:5-methylcytosine-specific restriction endonuclease McrBC regulatory subunit McrC